MQASDIAAIVEQATVPGVSVEEQATAARLTALVGHLFRYVAAGRWS